jgi:DNA polymerase II small subunit
LSISNDISDALIYAINKGYQIHPDAFALLRSINSDVSDIIKIIIDKKTKLKESHSILIDDIKTIIARDRVDNSISKSMSIDDNDHYDKALIYGDKDSQTTYEVLFDPTSKINSTEDENGFLKLFRSRYEKSLKILAMRPDSKRIKKIEKIKQEYNKKRSTNMNTSNRRNDEESLSNSSNAETILLAGLLMSRRQQKNMVEVTIDDMTGALSAVATTDDLRNQISMLVLDQMIMLEIENQKRGRQDFLIRSVISPEIPEHIPNKSRSESYVLLTSDLHIGSKYFMEAEFLRFVEWLSSDDDIGSKVKFLCIAGDIIDGIGIYPNQDKELIEIDASKQLMYAMTLLNQIPKNIEIFMIPGNHDLGRRALPQSSLSPFIDKSTDNFHMIGNPSLIKLDSVKLLMFHGQSLDDIIATTPGLSYSRPADAMKILLKARHLSPIYGERTPIAPEEEDMLVISEVPDIFHAGHVHIIDVGRHRNTLVVNSGAWQSQTKYQQTMGIMPTPGIVILINLSTLQLFQKNFII